MNGFGSPVRVGGGCNGRFRTDFGRSRPGSFSSSAFSSLERLKELQAKREREHQLWLASPEGQAALKEQEERNKRLAEEAEKARQEDERQQAWSLSVEQYMKTHDREVGCIIRAGGEWGPAEIVLGSREDEQGQEFDQFYTTRYFYAVYPDAPSYVLAPKHKYGFGLKCMLNKASREELRRRYPEATRWSTVPVKAIRIVGFSKTGKSAHCEVVEW